MDFSKAAMLLHVADKARQWPNLKKLEMAALAALEEIQNEDVGEPVKASVATPPPRRVAPSTAGDA